MTKDKNPQVVSFRRQWSAISKKERAEVQPGRPQLLIIMIMITTFEGKMFSTSYAQPLLPIVSTNYYYSLEKNICLEVIKLLLLNLFYSNIT